MADNAKVWLITGSSTGFGRSLTEVVLKKGDRVIATARKPEQLDDLVTKYFYVERYGGAKIKPSGSLIFTSRSGPRPHQAIATVVANAGVSLLAESLAKELAPVRVNVVAPYYVNTPMWAGMPDPERRELFERVGKQLPLARVAEIDDIAPVYLHLIQSSYITGTTIPVNGGALLQTME